MSTKHYIIGESCSLTEKETADKPSSVPAPGIPAVFLNVPRHLRKAVTSMPAHTVVWKALLRHPFVDTRLWHSAEKLAHRINVDERFDVVVLAGDGIVPLPNGDISSMTNPVRTKGPFRHGCVGAVRS